MDTTCMCNKLFFGSYDLSTVIVKTVVHIFDSEFKGDFDQGPPGERMSP